MLFVTTKTLSTLLRYFNLEKRLVKKAKVNFKIHDVTNWETNIYNTHIAQYFRT